MKYVQVTNADPSLIEAIRRGDVEGDVYADGEVWLPESALIPTLPLTDAVTP